MTETTFTEVCEVLEKIQNTKQMSRKEDIFKDFLAKLKTNNTSLYAVIRLVIPILDNLRPKSGLHIHTIGKMYIKALHLGVTGES